MGIKHIVIHVKGKRDKGLIMRENLQLHLHADADFAGLFTSEDKLDQVSVKIRIGILLKFSEVPLCWSSKN